MRLLVTANVVPCLSILVTLMMEAIHSSKTSVTSILIRAAWRHIPKDSILHSHCHENLTSYIIFMVFVSPTKQMIGLYHDHVMTAPYSSSFIYQYDLELHWNRLMTLNYKMECPLFFSMFHPCLGKCLRNH
jgi:hypothetical protein